MRDKKLSMLIEGAIMIAVAEVLSMLPTGFGPYNISIGVIPIILFAFRHGTVKGFLIGFTYGLLKIVLGDIQGVVPLQIAIEYSVPYLSLGLAGLVGDKIRQAAKRGDKAYGYIAMGTIIGCFARYIWHYIAGVVYWGHFAPEGQSPYVYSLIVNGGSMVVTTIATIIVLSLLYANSKRLFRLNV